MEMTRIWHVCIRNFRYFGRVIISMELYKYMLGQQQPNDIVHSVRVRSELKLKLTGILKLQESTVQVHTLSHFSKRFCQYFAF